MTKILVIDADLAEAKNLQVALQQVDIESQTTTDGNEGLQMARSYMPNCIILCVELVGISGYTICNKLKKDPVLSTIPLLITSSQATTETFEQHSKLKTRADGYLRKPYRPEQFIEMVQQLLGLLGVPTPTAQSVTNPQTIEPFLDIDVSLPVSSEDASVVTPLDAPIAVPTATPVDLAPVRQAPTTQAKPSSEPSRASTAASIEGMQQQEVRQLRHKVQELEQALQDQQMAFGDKLLQQSESFRDHAELKTKLTAQELEISKLQQAAQSATSQVAEVAEKLRQTQALQQTAIHEKQELIRELAQNQAQLKESQNTVQRLQQQTLDLQKAVENANKQLQELQESRLTAKLAVDRALQDL